MKARKINSGDEWREVIYAQLEGSDVLYREENLEFQDDTTKKSVGSAKTLLDDNHWQDVRERAAISAMQGLLSAPFTQAMLENTDNAFKAIASMAIEQADLLVENLKKAYNS